MDKDKAPQVENPEPPYYEVKGGRVYIEGVDVTNQLNIPAQPEDEPGETVPEPVEEGTEEEVKEEPEKAEPEPEPEPEKEEPEEEAEPEEESETEEPEPIKLKLKYKGEEYEENLSQEDIAMRLQRLRFMDETQKETFERSKELEPYWHLMKSDWFKEKVKEAKETGEFELPPAPPEPPDEVMFKISRLETRPDYNEVMFELQNQAVQMPEKARNLIDTNPNIFLSEFERVAQEVRSKKEPPHEKTEKKEKPSPKEVKEKLELKESRKERAQVTKPGTPPEPLSPQQVWAKREKQLIKQIRACDKFESNKRLSLIADLMDHRDKYPT